MANLKYGEVSPTNQVIKLGKESNQQDTTYDGEYTTYDLNSWGENLRNVFAADDFVYLSSTALDSMDPFLGYPPLPFG